MNFLVSQPITQHCHHLLIIIRFVEDNSCLAFICWEDKDVVLFQIPQSRVYSGGERLEGGGLALERTRDTRFQTAVASSCDKLDKDLSTEDINSETGMRNGDRAKLRPFLRTSSSFSRREVLDRLTTHRCSVLLLANLPEMSLSNLAFCRSLHFVVSAAKTLS